MVALLVSPLPALTSGLGGPALRVAHVRRRHVLLDSGHAEAGAVVRNQCCGDSSRSAPSGSSTSDCRRASRRRGTGARGPPTRTSRRRASFRSSGAARRDTDPRRDQVAAAIRPALPVRVIHAPAVRRVARSRAASPDGPDARRANARQRRASRPSRRCRWRSGHRRAPTRPAPSPRPSCGSIPITTLVTSSCLPGQASKKPSSRKGSATSSLSYSAAAIQQIADGRACHFQPG